MPTVIEQNAPPLSPEDAPSKAEGTGLPVCLHELSTQGRTPGDSCPGALCTVLGRCEHGELPGTSCVLCMDLSGGPAVDTAYPASCLAKKRTASGGVKSRRIRRPGRNAGPAKDGLLAAQVPGPGLLASSDCDPPLSAQSEAGSGGVGAAGLGSVPSLDTQLWPAGLASRSSPGMGRALAFDTGLDPAAPAHSVFLTPECNSISRSLSI